MSMFARFLLPLFLGLVVGCAGGNSGDGQGTSEVSLEDSRRSIEFSGLQKKSGLFDISLEYGPDGVGWMAVSRVQIPKFVDTHIARSLDNGRTWSYVTSVGESREGTLTVNGAQKQGAWRDETPSLLHDPDDGPERRWKLFTNNYFVEKPFKPKSRLLGHGVINVRHAASPAGPWSRPECIIGNAPTCKMQPDTSHPDLADVRMNTEPATIVEDGTIYLAVDAGSTDTGLGEWENYRVVLYASENHGETWRYVGKLLDHKDAKRFGYRVFTGVSLVRVQGKIFVLATPSGAYSKKNKGHDGAMAIEVSNIGQSEVRRDPTGKPLVAMRLEPASGSGGLADYDEQNTAGGVVFSEIQLLKFPRVFRLYQTNERLDVTSASDP